MLFFFKAPIRCEKCLLPRIQTVKTDDNVSWILKCDISIFYSCSAFTPPEQQSEQVQDLLEDIDRIKFHKAYLAALARAIRWEWTSSLKSETYLKWDMNNVFTQRIESSNETLVEWHMHLIYVSCFLLCTCELRESTGIAHPI